MKLGQTSIIYFFSNVFASIAGTFATLYIARVLGAGPLGIYNLVVGLVAWLAIVGQVGLSGAIAKRVSEGDESGEYAIAGAVIIISLAAVVSVGVVLFRSYVNQYINYPGAWFVAAILLVTLAYGIVSPLLSGLHLVHVQGILSTVKTVSRSGFQILAVFAGLGISGLLIGHIIGFVIVTIIGLYFVRRELSTFGIPTRRHFSSLLDYAKFSWLGGLRSQMYAYTDVIVLGFFVPSALIGVYSVAWNVGTFLIMFSGSLKSTLFPEMSELASERGPQAVSDSVEKSLTFAGLFLIPGLFGGAILAERILRIYGPEFPQGATILLILIAANLLMGYQSQFLNTLNAIDRPDIAFRVNGVFVVSNLVFNVILIYLYGWIGAAVATTSSVAISLILGYYYVTSIIDLNIPFNEIGKQLAASLVMAALVSGGLYIENSYRVLRHNIATVLLLVAAGATIYFAILLVLSSELRETVRRNAPDRFPFVRFK
jgi:O-antigen/teichoic acid export membrane protein